MSADAVDDFVGVPGSNNDVNVVDRSPLMIDWLEGNAPAYSFTVNGNDHSMCYLLCDGIYPSWYAALQRDLVEHIWNEKLARRIFDDY
ncbi:hypothetical protein ATCC90586_010960 [Pythium insidiosum]|nr:hypothetical protein ATCC90586_010960 [Pythium insidiosum]